MEAFCLAFLIPNTYICNSNHANIRNMKNFLSQKLTCFAVAFSAALMLCAEDVVTIHSPGAGQLQLSKDALVATKLKVTGRIDARDFATLKPATMVATQELDLSEAVIEAYYGVGCYSPITSDWIVGTTKKQHFRANAIPLHAFTKVGDNSLRKWHYGSSSLIKIVLPDNASGIEAGAFQGGSHVAEIEVSKFSTAAKTEGNALYDYAMTTLRGVAPKMTDVLVLPPTVVSVADSALHDAVLRGIEIKTVAKVDFGKQGEFSCPYILTPRPEDYAGMFEGIDVTSEIREARVEQVEAGTLIDRLGSAGWTRNDVRSVTATGEIAPSDMTGLNELPNLHFLDLSGAVYTGTQLTVSAGSLCSLRLPQGSYELVISACPFLGGTLSVPEGVTAFACAETPLITDVTLPSTIAYIGEKTFQFSLLERLDLSSCVQVEELPGFSSSRLRSVSLPPNLKRLNGLTGPVADIALPASLEELYASGWNVEALELPASLKKIGSLDYMWHLKAVNAQRADKLTEVYGFNYCPLLETLDLSASPITFFRGLTFDAYEDDAAPSAVAKKTPRVVVTGRIHDGTVWSSLKTLRLPSTLQDLFDVSNCGQMETLDLFACNDLKNIGTLSGMKSMSVLKLPANLKTIETIRECPSLRQVLCAADGQVPTFSYGLEEGTLENVELRVPKGCKGRYAMSEYWADAASIVEDGYTVRVEAYLDGVLLTGSGLYPEGTSVTPGAPAEVGGKVSRNKFSYWQLSDGSTLAFGESFVPAAHVTATAIYGEAAPDLSQGDVTFTVNAETAGTLRMYAQQSTGPCEAYNESGLCASSEGSYLDIPLHAGENKIALVCEQPQYITVQNAWEYPVVMENFNLKTPESLLTLDLSYCSLSSIDLTGCSKLFRLYLYDNELSSLDVSACSSLETLDCSFNRLTELRLPAAGSQLSSLNVGANSLATLDLRGQSQLETVQCWNNRISVIEMDDDQSALSFFSSDMNSFAFAALNRQLYNAIVSANSQESRTYNEYVLPETLVKGGVLDLSHETKAFDGREVRISVSLAGTALAAADGKFSLPDAGYLYVSMTCAAFPDLTFIGTADVPESNGIAALLLDGVDLKVQSGAVEVSGSGLLAGGVLYGLDGRELARADGEAFRLNAPAAGIYVLRLFAADGRSAAVKLSIK